MTDHIPEKCLSGCTGCHICDGGLIVCKVCGCAEGELATHCPGSVVSSSQANQIFAGKLDFVDGKWVTK